MLALHRALLRLRREHAALQASDACACDARALDDDSVAFIRPGPDGCFLIVARLRGRGAVRPAELMRGRWRTVLDTEDPAFAADSTSIRLDVAAGSIAFTRPGAVVLQQTHT